jgi:hypothetical protein
MNLNIGDIVSFEARQVVANETGLCRSPSTYSYGSLELAPVPMDLYVVCRDGSLGHWQAPEVPIGWELIIKDDIPYSRISQFGFEPVEVRMVFRDKAPLEMVPKTNHAVGNRIEVCQPAEAEVTEQKDTDEEIISKYNPVLGACVASVNDPVQTAAMARFAEGKMSYAEMRGLCG